MTTNPLHEGMPMNAMHAELPSNAPSSPTSNTLATPTREAAAPRSKAALWVGLLFSSPRLLASL